MDMRKGVCLAAGGSLLAATIGLFAGPSVAVANTTSPVVVSPSVNDNTATANTIAGFDRHADGSLTPIPGSPFTIGGAGLGVGLGSQGAIQVTQGGRYLLAVDAGSNQISVLRVTATGVPVQVGQPVSSGGLEPVSVAISPDGLVYVANSDAGGSDGNFTGFRLGFDGTLTPVRGSTVAAPAGSGPADVLVNATGTRPVRAWAAPSSTPRRSTASWCCRTAACSPHRARLSPRRASARSARSSGLPIPRSCLSRTRTTAPAWARSPRSATASWVSSPRSGPRPTPTSRPRRAGGRSATTAATCSPSTPRRPTSPATPSIGTAHSS